MSHHRLIHQIYLSDEETNYPKEVLLNQEKFTENHCIWDTHETRVFLENVYPNKEVIKAYDRLRPGAFKADLARYCIINHFGGYYVDATVQNFKPFETFECDMVVFRDGLTLECFSSWHVSQGVFYSIPNNPVLIDCIERCIQNIQNEYYGKHPTWITGPGPFGQSLAVHGSDIKLEVGHLKWRMFRRNSFILPRGGVAGRGKRRFKRFYPFNALTKSPRGFNNYWDLYTSREVFQ